MKLFFRNIFLSFVTILLIGSTPVFAMPTPLTSSSAPTHNAMYKFTPLSSFTENKASILLQVNSILKFNAFGFAQMNTRVLISNSSNYVKIKMQLQRYKNSKWNTVTTGTYTGKGVCGYSWSYYVSKGYKYRVKNTIYLYKSKNGKLLDQDICYSNVKKR